MKVLIGAPVQQRGWILPLYLRHLTEMQIPDGVEVSYCFLLNNSTDSSRVILERFAERVPNRVSILEMNRPELGADRRETPVRRQTYHWLAELRNRLFDEAAEVGADYLLSVDCDNLLPPFALMQLLSDRRRAVAALVDNMPFDFYPEPYRYFNAMNIDPTATTPTGNPVWWHVKEIPVNTVFEVDMSGAVGLIAREVFTTCRYAYDEFGEDCGLSRQMLARGWRWAIDSRVRSQHIMRPERLLVDNPSVQPNPEHIYHMITPVAGGDVAEVELSPALVQKVVRSVWQRAFLQAAVAHYPVLKGLEVQEFRFDQARNVVVFRGPFHTPIPAGPAKAEASRGKKARRIGGRPARHRR